MFLLVETTLKVRLSDPVTHEKMYCLRLLFCQDMISIIYQLWRTISYQFLAKFIKSSYKTEHQSPFCIFFPSWCSSSRQRMRWIIFWRLVPGRREIFGQLTSPLRSTSCRRPTAGSWQTSKTLLDPGYTTSIWGKPRKQKFTRRLCSIARNLVVFPLPHPADSLLLSLLVFKSLSYFFVSFKAKCWTPCMTSTAVSRWATMWSRAALTATVSQVRLYIFILLHHLRLCLLGNI